MKVIPPLILASQSPRRSQLLTEAGFTFTVDAPADSVEKGICSNCGPDQLVVDAAVAKAGAIAQKNDDGIILGADTVASCKAEILGKPVDVDHARAMLKLMSGTVHQVLTGVCLWHRPSNRFMSYLERTTIPISGLEKQVRLAIKTVWTSYRLSKAWNQPWSVCRSKRFKRGLTN